MPLFGLEAVELTQLGGAAFTAVAAGASWASVLQNRKDRTARQTPDVYLTVLTDLETDFVKLHFVNRGGSATNVFFMVREGTGVLTGYLPPTAYIGPGASTTLRTSLTSANRETQEGLVVWRGLDKRLLYSRSLKGNYRSYSTAHWWSRGRRESNKSIYEKDYTNGDLTEEDDLFRYEVEM